MCRLMSVLFSSPSWVISSLLIVIPSILLCISALWLVRKGFSTETLRKNHDVAGFTFSIIGVLYSVILGFTVVNEQTRYNAAQEIIHTESTILADLYRDAEFFPPEGMKEIRSSLRKYVEYIIHEEWDVRPTRQLQIGIQSITQSLWHSYYKIDLGNERTRIFYQQSIDKLDGLMNARLAREFSTWERLSPMMWSLLIIGALITIGFMFFFGLESLRSQMLMTALLTGYLSFILYLVFSLDHIFRGPEGIKPTAFEQVLTVFDLWDQ